MATVTLADRLGVTGPYVHHLISGRRLPSPQWLDLMADAMKLTKEQRVDLHRAGAIDHGYKLSLRDA